ncbi:MAG: tRNA preQ1(34) S-adenosylmethionine ribosyltransferase-isomerase QueA [Planctomycetota bacterium]
MKLSDFDYELPEERIAQEPAAKRDQARLLVHHVDADATEHTRVEALVRLLAPGDLLIVNDTRVLPARVYARRATGGAVELLFLRPDPAAGPRAWEAMAHPARRLKEGEVLRISAPGEVEARLLARPDANWRVELRDPGRPELATEELLERVGRLPLPPYIERENHTRGGDAPERDEDRERYQTVFAAQPGAVAAPTAGLHFTPELLAALEQRGVRRAAVTLHVGAGTFLPVQVDDPREHEMHSERYSLSPATARAVADTRAAGGRVVAVGTTSVRVLESCCDDSGTLQPGSGETRLFLVPGARFRVVDALLTNFHLPRSTLLMLVSAFAGRERVLGLYREAVERDYRFYSYGDAMLLLRR